MMSTPKLTLELLNGPLDGLSLTLEADTEWSSTGGGPLSFPWDEELGTPQARFQVETNRWSLAALPNKRSTRHNMERIEDKVPLEREDLLKASDTWLLINQIE